MAKNESKRSDSLLSASNGGTEEREVLSELMAMNKRLCLSLQEKRLDLRQSKLKAIELSRKAAIDYVERFRTQLKSYGEYIRFECNRFYQNESMALRLKPIVDEITEYSDWFKHQRHRIRDESVRQKSRVLEDIDFDFEPIGFDHNPIPDLPELLAFYKSIIDEIPIEFFNDLNSTKRLAKEWIELRKSEGLAQIGVNSSVGFENMRQLVKVKTEVIEEPNEVCVEAPVLSVLPVLIKEEPIDPIVTESAFKFSTPKTSMSSAKEEVVVPKSAEKVNESFRMPVKAHPFRRKPTIASKLKVQSNEMSLNVEFDSKFDLPVIKTEIYEQNEEKVQELDKSKKYSNKWTDSRTQIDKSNESRQKLFNKISAKFPNMTEELVIIAIERTKEALISSGAHKGFSGMKMIDIIAKIKEWIDNELAPNGWTATGDQLSDTGAVSSCAICGKDVKCDSTINLKTQCLHWFHISCIKQWFKSHSPVCPKCSKTL